jgi:hypothetical protein
MVFVLVGLVIMTIAGFIAGYNSNLHENVNMGLVLIGICGVCIAALPIHTKGSSLPAALGLFVVFVAIYEIGKLCQYKFRPTVGRRRSR